MGLQHNVSEPGVLLNDESRDFVSSRDQELAAHFTTKLLNAKHSEHQKQPWVMLTSISKAPMLLRVYNDLKNQGALDAWSSEFCDVRHDTGICVLALMP